ELPMMTWNWPAWVKVPLADLIFSMRGTSALAGSFSTNRIRVTQWDTAAMFSLPPTAASSSLASSRYLPMKHPPSTQHTANLFKGANKFKHLFELAPVYHPGRQSQRVLQKTSWQNVIFRA